MSIDTEHVLPPHLVIPSAEDLLYDIGLCLTSVKEEPKPRKLLSRPKVIWIIEWIFFFQRFFSILIGQENRQALLILGDVGGYLGLKTNWNVLIIIAISIVISSQLNYYYNYKRGNNPTFLRVFRMMSGLVTPASVGLFQGNDVRKLTRLKILFTLVKLNTEYVIRVVGFGLIIGLFIVNEPWLIALTYGLANAIMFCLWVHPSAKVVIYQFLYLFILCTYLNIKLKNLNQTLKHMRNYRRFKNFQRILHSFDALYREIDEYNTTYWSKFLFSVWSLFGAFIAQLSFIAIFNETNIILKIMICYALFLILILFNFVFFITSSLNSHANKSYKLFNYLVVDYSRFHPISRNKMLNYLIKVISKNNIVIIHNNIAKFLRRRYSLKGYRPIELVSPVGLCS